MSLKALGFVDLEKGLWSPFFFLLWRGTVDSGSAHQIVDLMCGDSQMGMVDSYLGQNLIWRSVCFLTVSHSSFLLHCDSPLPQLQAEAPRLAEYQAYIDFEMKIGDPARIQLIFERALVENCLVPDLWIRYSQYLVRWPTCSNLT